jgi:hypothetical protein
MKKPWRVSPPRCLLLLSSTLRCRCRALWSSTRSLAFALLVLLVRKVLVLSRVVGNSKRVSRTSCRRSRDHGERKCDCVEHFHFIFPCLRIKKNRWRVSPPPVPFAQIPQLGSAAVVSVNSTHPCNFWISNPFGDHIPHFSWIKLRPHVRSPQAWLGHKKHSTHRALYRVGSGQVQEFLAGVATAERLLVALTRPWDLFVYAKNLLL